MAEGDSRSSSFSDIENDSILSGSVYSSAEVSEGDASSIASLSLPCTLPVGDIRPYRFEPERETPSEAEETLDLDGHFGEERLGMYKHKTSCFVRLKTLCSVSGASVVIANQCQRQESVCCQEIDKIKALLVGDPIPACITHHPEFSSACVLV